MALEIVLLTILVQERAISRVCVQRADRIAYALRFAAYTSFGFREQMITSERVLDNCHALIDED